MAGHGPLTYFRQSIANRANSSFPPSPRLYTNYTRMHVTYLEESRCSTTMINIAQTFIRINLLDIPGCELFRNLN